VGKKLMEVTELKKKLKTGRATLTLLDTSFSQLTRKITSNTGADYTTAAAGDPLSKELIVSLNEAQIALKERYETLFSDYNTWIISKQSKMSDLDTFDYEFSSVYDYSSGYTADYTSADYYMLTSIVNAEKELYEAGNYWFMNNLESNIDVVKEWSKTQNYGSSTSKVIGYFETYWGRVPLCTSCSVTGVSWSNVGGGDDKVWVHAWNLQNIPNGTTATFTIHASYWQGSDENGSEQNEYGYMYIKRTVIDGDSYYTCSATKGTLKDHGRIDSYVRTGTSATHFDTDTPSFSWLNSRTIL
jgi:hypothetical protein